jgi:lipopolysaccharide export system ATP-binding protein
MDNKERPMPNQLKVAHLAKTYKGRRVVNDISFEVNQGEIVGLLGPNGAGKTTSFYMLVGLVPTDEGHIFLNNDDITLTPMHQRARLGISYLPQEASIFRKLSVADNILAILELNPELNNKGREARLEQLLEEFNLEHLRHQSGMSLSGGERRRTEIARCLALNPKFILLDEPFAGVDPISVLDTQEIIQHLSQSGIGILITDHNVRETLSVCHRAYIVNDGRILASGKPNEIVNNQLVKEVYLGE